MSKSLIFIALTIFIAGQIVAQQISSLPVMLPVKAVQKTDDKVSSAIMDNSEHIYRVDANTLDDVLQTLLKDRIIRYYPDAVYTEIIREMNPHIEGKKIFEAGVFIVPQSFENKSEKRYGFNYGAREPWVRDEDEAAEHLQALLASYPNLEQWETRKQMLRENILRQIQLDPLPQKTPLNPIYSKTRRYKGYTVTNVALETVPGYWIYGSLYQPINAKGKTPAMLSAHGHFHFPVVDDSLMNERGRFRPDMQYRCAMLARMGVAVFSYEMFAYGGEASLQIPYRDHRTPLALTMQLWNSIRITDFLCSLETVDPTKIGITGASGGGTQTFLLAAVDPRIAFSGPAVMVSAHYYGGCACESGLPITQTHCGLNSNNTEIAALMAPRPQLLISIGADWTKNTPTTEYPYLQKIYGFYGSTNKVENVHIPDEQHDYGYTKREALYNFVTKVCGIDAQKFKDAQGRYIEKDVTIENPDNLLVFGNGRIVNGKYVLQPVRTRPMMPVTDINGAEDLKRALKKLQTP
jgi:dienelactone hydrolase